MRACRAFLAFAILVTGCACGTRQAGEPLSEQQQETVTVYVSTDRVFSEPVLRTFEQRSGIRVNAVYDTEETKSTGLANRLLAERERPQADVFWSNEPVRSLVLQSRGVLAPYRSPSAADIPETFKDPEGYWTAFSARVRVIAYNTKLVAGHAAPVSVLDLADPKWKGQVAIADPRFGSTSFHVAALYVMLGDEADGFFRRLKSNDVKIVAIARLSGTWS
jgi:iron(III) transport system substrate-binding protein